uniref:G2/mitotic-specific cyclin-B3 n=1 Tax=Rhabditophanes sp. KR3021 TaxID=114890 RepID=A0AC35TK10_9BILA
MQLRNRAAAAAGNQQELNPQENKLIVDKKRHAAKDVNEAEPKAKRNALTDLSRQIHNFVIDSSRKDASKKSEVKKPKTGALQPIAESKSSKEIAVAETKKVVKKPAYDFDKECAHDIASNAVFANDIFVYYRSREPLFKVTNYTEKHRDITHEMRMILGDWMVEVQENFELYHETLYLAVKLVDIYLDKVDKVRQEQLQLLGSSAIFVASKFDERSPPLIDDFLYICNESYKRQDLIDMEIHFLQVVGFEALTAPLSYRFLRRYSRVIKSDMQTLTAARYLLESSLLCVEYAPMSESKIAAACLLWALRVKKVGDWDPILEQYSGYSVEEIEPLMMSLNHMVAIRKTFMRKVSTVFEKYSHEIFFRVSLLSPLTDIYEQAGNNIVIPANC